MDKYKRQKDYRLRKREELLKLRMLVEEQQKEVQRLNRTITQLEEQIHYLEANQRR